MADVLLFGASGYTGRLVARALGDRKASFAVAGRNLDKLEAVAAAHGAQGVYQAGVGDIDGLVKALEGARVLVSCVGPFLQLGDTAVAAALRAGTHYLDSTGEAPFVERLIRNHHERASELGVALAPAMGFDEVVADVAATLAVAGGGPETELALTYALPSGASRGSVRSAVGLLGATVPWGRVNAGERVRAGDHRRWAPMPPPLGPRRSVSFPLAEAHLAPLHLELDSLKTLVTVQASWETALRMMRAARPGIATRMGGLVLARSVRSTRGEPALDQGRGRWTVLAEARWRGGWRNVAISGRDPYSLTAQTMAAGAAAMAAPGFQGAGVLGPVSAVGVEGLQAELESSGSTIQFFGAE